MYVFGFFSITAHCKKLHIVPCAMQWVPVACLFYIYNVYLLIPNSSSIPPPSSPLVTVGEGSVHLRLIQQTRDFEFMKHYRVIYLCHSRPKNGSRGLITSLRKVLQGNGPEL